MSVAAGPRVGFAQQRSAVDIAQARELLNQGLKLRDQGDPNGALEKLRGAHALANTPITAIELGRTYAAIGKLIEARETFLSVDRIPVQPEETARSATARKESARLAEQVRPRLPSLTVKITGVSPDSVAVTIDGAAVPPEALAAPRLLNPGSHGVFARSTSGGTAETTVDLQEGESRDVELKIVFTEGAPAPVAAQPAVGPTEPAPTPAENRVLEARPSALPLRTFAWSLLGGGAGVAAAGGVVMIMESGRARDANKTHDRGAYDSASSVWTIGLVGSIVGAAAIAGGGILIAASPSSGARRQTQGSVWLGLGVNDLRFGGIW